MAPVMRPVTSSGDVEAMSLSATFLPHLWITGVSLVHEQGEFLALHPPEAKPTTIALLEKLMGSAGAAAGAAGDPHP